MRATSVSYSKFAIAFGGFKCPYPGVKRVTPLSYYYFFFWQLYNLDVLGNKVKFDTENQPQLQGRYMCVIKSKAVRRVTCFEFQKPRTLAFYIGGNGSDRIEINPLWI